MVGRAHSFGERYWEETGCQLSCSGNRAACAPLCPLLWVWPHLLWLADVCAGDTCPFQAEASRIRFPVMSSLCLALVIQVLLAQVTKCRNDAPPPKGLCCQHTQTYMGTWALGADARVREKLPVWRPWDLGIVGFFFFFNIFYLIHLFGCTEFQLQHVNS